MKDVSENELLSAYVDDELTAQERVEVEQLIQASPAAKQLVDELQAMREGILALPRFQLSEDLSQRILRRAERQILGEPAIPAGRGPDGSQRSDWQPFWRRLLQARTLVWAGLAVAIAIVLAVADRGEKPGRRAVAVKPQQEPATRPSTGIPSIGPVREPATEPSRQTPQAAESALAEKRPPARLGEAPPVPMKHSLVRDLPAGEKPQSGGRRDASKSTPVVSCRIAGESIASRLFPQIIAEHGATIRTKSSSEDAAVFDVELTPTQYHAVLKDLRGRKDDFQEVSPPPSLGGASALAPSTGGQSYRVQRVPAGSKGDTKADGSRVTAQNEPRYLVRFVLRVDPGE